MRFFVMCVLALGCGHQPLQKHAARPTTPERRCGQPAPGGLLWDPAFPHGMTGDTGSGPVEGAVPGGGGGGSNPDRKCDELDALTVRAEEAATANDCATLAQIDARVCTIDPVFLANVFVARVHGASCRRSSDAIRRCANAD